MSNKIDNENYWSKRIEDVMIAVYNLQEKKNIIILQEYKKELNNIKLILSELYSKMENSNISLSEAYKYNRLKSAEAQIIERIEELGKQEENFLRNSLINNYTKSSKLTEKAIKNKIDISFTLLNKKAIESAICYPWSGEMFSNRIWINKANLTNSVKQIITRGLIQGQSYSDMSKELKQKFDTEAYNCRRLIRTETAHIVNQANLDRYKNSGVVDKVQWWTCEDERTCSKCNSLHMKVFDIDKVPITPQHPNCRCCLIPVIDI